MELILMSNFQLHMLLYTNIHARLFHITVGNEVQTS